MGGTYHSRNESYTHYTKFSFEIRLELAKLALLTPIAMTPSLREAMDSFLVND